MLKSLFGAKVQPFVRACFVHANPAADRAIVSIVHNVNGGMFVAQRSVALRFGDKGALGAAIDMALAQCRAEQEITVRSDEPAPRRTRKDDPAFQASGRKTLKAFEQDYIPLTVTGANEFNLIYEVNGPVLGPYDLAFEASAVTPQEIAESVHLIVRESQRFLAQGSTASGASS
jgi:hypothetical protein